VAEAGPTGEVFEADFDPAQLRQVLLNIIQNAVDAVSGPGGPPPGQRRVEVSLGRVGRDSRRHVVISVKDNGPGVKPADRNRIFTPFFTTKETGTGLGLPVCKGIIEAHGGRIEVSSPRGEGAEFRIVLSAPEAAS